MEIGKMNKPGRKRTLTVAAVAALMLSAMPTSVRADGRVHLWGFQRGCEQLEEIDRLVERNLYAETHDVGLLRSPKGQPLPTCQGERCGQVLERSCPQASGRVLGGQVVQGRDTLRIRLWLYDLGTKQLAYQDDYCQSCDILSAVSAQAKRLMQQPRFGEPAGYKPSYCTEPTTAPSSSGPLFLSVFGDSKHKAAVLAALRTQLETLGRSVTQVPGEPKSYSRDVLLSIVSGQRSARVLGADVQKDGKVALFLFDQKTELTDAKTVTCPDCDRDTLVAQVKQSASDLLDRCIGLQCAGTGTPPVEACEPFPEQSCGADLLSAGPTAPVGGGGRYIDPKTAKLIKGLTWGAFAASAATAVGLFAANAAGAGRLVGTFETNTQPLVNPAYAATALAAVTLGVAIPVTLIVQRAQATSAAGSATPSGPASPIQCPN